MSPTGVRERVVATRASWVREMTASLASLPLSETEFLSDPRNPAAAESFLRRGLEALLDLGRHVLAKGFGMAVTEYKEIAARLREAGVLDEETARLMRKMAGYRNRMVHFYDAVSAEEIRELATSGRADIDSVLDALLRWVAENPDRVDRS